MNITSASITSKQLKDLMVGKQITEVIANQNPHSFVWFAMDPSSAFQNDKAANDVAKYLQNRTIDNVDFHGGAYGFYNYIYLGNRALMSDIVPRYTRPNGKPPKKHQLLLKFDDGSFLSFSGSLGGAIFLFEVDEEGYALAYKSEQPMIDTDEFSYSYFTNIIARFKTKSLTVKQLIATKNRISGIDNNLLQDILWEAKVNPKSKIVNLSEDEIYRIYTAIKSVPSIINTEGGKDIDKDIYGNYGTYKSRASRNTLGKPCARCETAIVKEAYLGGSIFYCPCCQKFSK